MVDVLLLVPARDEHRYGDSWLTLFERLAAPLRAHGLTVEAQPWTDPVAPSQARLVMPSLAWGYHARQADWFAQLDAFEASGVRMVNAPSVLRWNSTKTYLVELAGKGAPVVPTHAHDRLTADAVEAAFEAFGVDEVVVKPQVSAGSHETIRVKRRAALDGGPTGPALIQPFLSAVGEEGELSLFFFDGQFSHAVAKVAVDGDFRVQPQFGGRVSEIAPEPEALRVVVMVLEVVGFLLTYVCVDLIWGFDHMS